MSRAERNRAADIFSEWLVTFGLWLGVLTALVIVGALIVGMVMGKVGAYAITGGILLIGGLYAAAHAKARREEPPSE